MTSDKNPQANRRNALKSTGRKTPERKGHMPRRYEARPPLVGRSPGEDESALKDLSERLRAKLQPVGELKDLLVDRVIAATWRLHRFGRAEVGIFAWESYEELAERAWPEALTTKAILRTSFEKPRITDEQKHQEVLSKAEEAKAKQDTGTATLGRSFIRDANEANAFLKLSCYETTIERSLYKALHELQRLQAARGVGSNVSLPVAVDVDVSGVLSEGL